MLLQLSLDRISLEEAFGLVDQTFQSIDIIEAGTPLVLKYGQNALTLLKERYPGKLLLADYKIMDGAQYESSIAFTGGADIVSVLGFASEATVKGAVSAARKLQKRIMVDMIGIKDVKNRISYFESLGVDYLCIHTAIDEQGGLNSPIAELQQVSREVTTLKIAVAGGINLTNIDQILLCKPEILVIGSGITTTANPGQSAAEVKRRMLEANHEPL